MKSFITLFLMVLCTIYSQCQSSGIIDISADSFMYVDNNNIAHYLSPDSVYNYSNDVPNLGYADEYHVEVWQYDVRYKITEELREEYSHMDLPNNATCGIYHHIPLYKILTGRDTSANYIQKNVILLLDNNLETDAMEYTLHDTRGEYIITIYVGIDDMVIDNSAIELITDTE